MQLVQTSDVQVIVTVVGLLGAGFAAIRLAMA